MHFPGARSPRDSRISESGEGAQVKTDEGWTKRMKRGKTAAPQTDHHLTSVPPDDGTTLAGRECLQANLCRSLERVSTRPSTLPDVILRWPRGSDARLWQPGADGLPRISLPALGPGQEPGGDELHIVLVLAVCQSLR